MENSVESVKVYNILNSIKNEEGNLETSDIADFLKRKDLIEAIPQAEYENSFQEFSEKIDSKEHEKQSLKDSIEQTEKELNKSRDNFIQKEEKMNSLLHRIFTSKKKLEEENKEKKYFFDMSQKLEREVNSLNKKKSQVSSDLNELIEDKKELEQYKPADIGYINLTNQGSEVLRKISARLPRLQNVPYSEFKKEFDETEAKINGNIGKFRSFYEYLKDRGLGESKEEVDYSLALSGFKGGLEEICNEASRLDQLLSKNFGDVHEKAGRKRLKTVVSLMDAQRKESVSIGDLRKLYEFGVEEEFEFPPEEREQAHKETLFIQANLLKIPGKSPEEKFEKYREMQKKLSPTLYNQGNFINKYVSSNLAQKERNVEELEAEFSSTESGLGSIGLEESPERSLASLMIAISAKPHNYNVSKSLEEMRSYGWEDRPKYYPVAAAISLMPGTIEENVQLLGDVTGRLKEDRLGYATGRAVTLLSRAYNDLASSKETPNFVYQDRNFGHFTQRPGKYIKATSPEYDMMETSNLILIAAAAGAFNFYDSANDINPSTITGKSSEIGQTGPSGGIDDPGMGGDSGMGGMDPGGGMDGGAGGI